jgi:oligoendopeptidase F
LETATHPVDETWDLSAIFADDEDFERARDELEAGLPELVRWKGRLGESATLLADALEALNDAYRAFFKLRSYATMRSDRDTRVAAHQERRQRIELLGTRISSGLSFVRPEILALPAERIERFISEESRLAPHAFYLRDLNRQRAHVLGPAEERIMAEAGLMMQSASSLYNVLSNAELPRPEIGLRDGRQVRLTPVEFHVHRASTHRADRESVFKTYFSAYASFRDSLGQNLFAAIKSHLFRARARGYESCLHAALDRDNVPVTVYRNLVERVRERLPLLQRYLRLRGRALGVERLEYWDLYCPLVAPPKRAFSPLEATRVVAASLAPLGEEYGAQLNDAFEQRWIDWHPAPGKRSGAYATGWAYDAHPYVLLNHTENFEGVSTLAHEMGHAMHSFYSNRTQPFATADYSIFVAEVASTLNEALLAHHMIDAATSGDERSYLLASHLDGLRGTLFRQAMFAEFELEIHERAARGEALTGERLDELYLALLRDYHGHDDGVMNVDEAFAIEWAAIPHFYYDFYVYQYSTGVVAATALAGSLLAAEPGARDRYLEFLRAGGSDYPLELLRGAGVDLETRAPYASAFESLELQLDRLEAELGAQATEPREP